jgi:hypothetical protein
MRNELSEPKKSAPVPAHGDADALVVSLCLAGKMAEQENPGIAPGFDFFSMSRFSVARRDRRDRSDSDQY